MRVPLLLFVLLLGLGPATGQDEPEGTPEAGEELPLQPVLRPDEANTLRSLTESLALVEVDIAAKRELLRTAVSEEERSAIYQDVVALQDKQRALLEDFESVATGIDMKDFNRPSDLGFDLATEVENLLQPIVRELKSITEQPRMIEELRSELGALEDRQLVTQRALANLAALEEKITDPVVKTRLQAMAELWTQRAAEANNRMAVVRYQLAEAESKQQSVFDAGASALTSFFRSRGRNLILTILTFFGVFFVLRFLQRYVDRVGLVAKRKQTPFAARLFHVAFHAFTFIGALGAAMIVLYASGDWVLMGVAMIVVVALLLAAKNALPRFLEQTRLILNLGEVREGERVMFQGVPWLVERLSFYTTLVNPELTGGLVRLPLRQLSNLISRPVGDGELWFPSRAGDWILLGDDNRGRVLTQTPEMVHLVLLGGTRLSYLTPDFLSLNPKNLSANFRLKSTFGVDYRHQALATTEIPSKLWKKLMTEMVKVVDREHLLDLKVEFKAAGASSLDYEIIADFSGEVASRSEMLLRALQRFAVEACNENGWEIPFNQVTVHHRPDSESVSTEPAEAEPKPKLP